MYGVRFEDVTKRYPRGGPRYASLRDDAARRLGGLRRGVHTRQESPGTLALDGVSFEVEEGESFGIIGPNGAGKTTALKLISRISYPSSGLVRVRGTVGALIDVSSGVHPELSGRENIMLYGRILGMSRSEIRRRFDEIVEFAELGHALEMPVKMYSSGMQLRLGFSIAAHLEPAVFIVDEALAVGDAGFQAKCVERMTKLVKGGRTLLFVSHDLSALEAICDRGAFLAHGRIQAYGAMSDVLRSYLDWIDTERESRLAVVFDGPSSPYLQLERATCHGADGVERYAFATGEDVEVRLLFRALSELRRPYVSVGITAGGAETLALCSMLVDGGPPERINGAVSVSCLLRSVPLLPRVYELWCSVRSEMAYGDLFDWQRVGTFRISHGPVAAGPAAQAHVSAVDGPVYIAHDWMVQECR